MTGKRLKGEVGVVSFKWFRGDFRMNYKMKSVKVCDWIDWCDILKKTFNRKKVRLSKCPYSYR